MLDPHLFDDAGQHTLTALGSRGIDKATVASVRALSEERRANIHKADALRHAMNQASDGMQLKARDGLHAELEATRATLLDLKGAIKAADDDAARSDAALLERLLLLPNLPDPAVPRGRDAADNRVERCVGTKKTFNTPPKPHWDLVQDLDLINFERAQKIAGARFAVYQGAAARLERALSQLMLDHARQHGHLELAVPLLVRPETMIAAGQYPKFVGEAFETQDGGHVLIPTAEVPLLGLHQDEIIDGEALPLRYTALTPCFRREAGAAGKDTRGLIRTHQFYKVELFTLCTPEHSQAEHARLTHIAEGVLQLLELPYRCVSLCTGDLGFCAATTYDLEVWLPGQNTYREISSCSNCSDFQARRANIRYRPQQTGAKRAKPRLLHTLNGSALAVSRTFVAIVENGQQADGSIRLPQALAAYFGADILSGP